MTQPAPNTIYTIELCSGERRRWRLLAPTHDDGKIWWHDEDSGAEFAEDSLMYAWRILDDEDAPATEQER